MPDAATTPPTEGAMLAAQTEDDTAAQYAWCSGCALSDTSAVTRAEPNPDWLGFLNATDSEQRIWALKSDEHSWALISTFSLSQLEGSWKH